MDIYKYIDFFHDGSLFDVKHQDNSIEFSMSSAEMDKGDLVDDATLSDDNCIQGKLHIEGVKKIKVNHKPIQNKVRLIFDRGQIRDFELGKNFVELGINWINFPPKTQINEFNTIEIEAEKIWWENIPNLENCPWSINMKNDPHFGFHKFKNKTSGEIIEFHRGKSGKHGHQSRDHFHRPNPAKTGDKDWYLDAKRNPVSKNSDASHLYPSNNPIIDDVFDKKKNGDQNHTDESHPFLINLSNYTDYFHDGSIIAIKHSSKDIELTMVSSEMDKEDLVDDIVLSKDEYIQGKLHLKGVNFVKVDGALIHGKLKQTHDERGVFDFHLTQHTVELKIIWVNFPPKKEDEKFSVIEIEAGKIWWQNIPDLRRNL